MSAQHWDGGFDVKRIREFWNNESGATSIEYALIAAGIAVAIITGVNAIGSQLNTKFNTIKTKLT